MLVCFPISSFPFNGLPGDLLSRFHEFNIITQTNDPVAQPFGSGAPNYFDQKALPTQSKKHGNYREADDNRYQLPTTQRVAYGKRYCHVTGFGIITNHFFHMKVNPSVHKDPSYTILIRFRSIETFIDRSIDYLTGFYTLYLMNPLDQSSELLVQ